MLTQPLRRDAPPAPVVPPSAVTTTGRVSADPSVTSPVAPDSVRTGKEPRGPETFPGGNTGGGAGVAESATVPARELGGL
ncbi:hypothetical protein [Streptosporangium sp. NPDC048865]|uniref:hypothetical protein n=1 Tax=Streptosporangium sp. NPDC048865 TaxID=3155766 RepID=UPI003415EC76